MKKNLLLAASILTVGGLLAACGTADTTEENTENADTTAEDTVDEAVEEEGAEDVPAEDVAEEPAEETTDEENVETPEEPAEEPAEDSTTETDSSEETIETEGTLTASDEQPYEMYVLDGYELTAAEPGRDSLYLSENGSVFMRIETFTPEELDFAYAEDVMKQTLQAVNEEAEVTEGPSLEGSEFVHSSVYEVPSKEGKVTGIVFEKENFIVRLTIFDDESVNATEDFIQMGKTIEPTE